MKGRRSVTILFSDVVSCWWAGSAFAASTTQSFTLHPGWNSVFLEVQPEWTAPAEGFFANTFYPNAAIADPVSVWRWIPGTSMVEFI